MDDALRNYYLDALGITRWLLRRISSVDLLPAKTTCKLNTDSATRLITWHFQQAEPQVIFLAEAQCSEEHALLKAIMQACAKNVAYAHGQLQAEIKDAQDFIQAFPMSCNRILVFGVKQAKLLDSTFTRAGIYSLGAVKICVSYYLNELIANPNYKRILWDTWKNL